MTCRVLATPSALAGLQRARGSSARLLDGALDALEDDPCDPAIESYRLRGGPPWDRLCRLTVGSSNLRIVYALGPHYDEVTILAVGHHDDSDTDIYRAVAALFEATVVPASVLRAQRRRCCAGGQPPRLTVIEATGLKATALSRGPGRR